MKGKKGAEMTIGTIIIIILAILVLVFLVYGFSTGWANLWDRLSGLTGGGNNVDSIKQACSVACSTNSVSDFTDTRRTVRFANGDKVVATCKQLEGSLTAGKCYLVNGTIAPGNGVNSESKCNDLTWKSTKCMTGTNDISEIPVEGDCDGHWLKEAHGSIVSCDTL